MNDPLDILIVSHNALRRDLGAPKVLIEIGEALPPFGWRVDFLQPSDFGLADTTSNDNRRLFSERLRQRLANRSKQFDVVDYDHEFLPYSRNSFPGSTLMVARSVLLVHQFGIIPLPSPPGFVPALKRLIVGHKRRRAFADRIDLATATFQQADLINVSNRHDREELVRRGFDAKRIVVLPFGINAARVPLFDAIDPSSPARPMVAFVGTFDYRKGAREFPSLLRSISAKVDGVRFKFLGTKGLFPDESSVRAKLPVELQDSIEVVPQFEADRLPAMLADCSAGVFPSHIEGFGFGVLEMLASGLPVIAYDAPGPPEMLPAEWLVPRGDVAAMAAKVAALLCDSALLGPARIRARERARPFTWDRIARDTDAAYRNALAAHRSALT